MRKKKQPTARQLGIAEGIARRNGVSLKPEFYEDAGACRDFIDFHQRRLPVSECRLKEMTRLQDLTGLVPPPEVSSNDHLAERYSVVLTEVESMPENTAFSCDTPIDDEAPTDAMVAYAKGLAKELGLELPENVIRNWQVCHEFIRYCLARRPPTEKMIRLVEEYSIRLGIETPSLILESRSATWSWIGVLKRIAEFRRGVGLVLPEKKV